MILSIKINYQAKINTVKIVFQTSQKLNSISIKRFIRNHVSNCSSQNNVLHLFVFESGNYFKDSVNVLLFPLYKRVMYCRGGLCNTTTSWQKIAKCKINCFVLRLGNL